MGFQWLDTFHVGCTPSPSEEARDFCKSLAPGSLLPVLLWSSGGKVEAGFFVRTAVFFWKRLGDCKTGRRPRGLMLTIFLSVPEHLRISNRPSMRFPRPQRRRRSRAVRLLWPGTWYTWHWHTWASAQGRRVRKAPRARAPREGNALHVVRRGMLRWELKPGVAVKSKHVFRCRRRNIHIVIN